LRQGVPEFSGIKLSQDIGACTAFDVNKVEVVRMSGSILVETAGVIGAGSVNGGGNSGFQALNIAVQFGAKRIVLVGFDMRLDRGVHWHGRHPSGLNNPGDPLFVHWRRALNSAASTLADLGVEVINASPISTLTAYPVMSLKEAISC